MADRQQAQAAGQQRQNAITALLSGAKSEQEVEDRLLNSNIPEFIGMGQESRKKRADAAKVTAETDDKKLDAQNRRLIAWRDASAQLRSKDDVIGYVNAMRQDPLLAGTPVTSEPIEAIVARIPDDPAQLSQYVQQLSLGMTKWTEMNKPQYMTQNLGGTSQITAVPGMGGAPSVVSSSTITQSPDNKASVGAQYAIAAAGREQATATRDAAKITARASDETGLRKEFADLPEVKKLKNAIPAYKAIVEAAKTQNPQADINLIYGLAKLYDPDSVVREGEYATIANSQAIPEWLKGQAQALVGGGRLTPATKQQILAQAKIRIDSFKSEYDGARTSFETIAKDRGLNPKAVFPEVGGQLDAQAAPAVPAQTATNPKTGEKLQLVNGQWVPMK